MADKKLNLMLHTGGQHVTLDDVIEATTPEATDTWYPISHESLIDRVHQEMGKAGLVIKHSAHGLWKDGLRYFGMMEITDGQDNNDYSLVMGLRNSHDKSFPAAIALGAGVFVCDNLSFSGEVKLARRHTKNIERDLPEVIQKAMGRFSNLRNSQEKRIEAYKNTPMNDKEAHDFIVRAFMDGVIGQQRVRPVVDQWHNPNHSDFEERTMWSLFNDFTEVLKPRPRKGNNDNNNLLQLPAATQKLHLLADSQSGLILDIVKNEILG